MGRKLLCLLALGACAIPEVSPRPPASELPGAPPPPPPRPGTPPEALDRPERIRTTPRVEEPKWPPRQLRVERYAIAFEDSVAAELLDPANEYYWPGQFFADGVWRPIDLRQRGSGARSHPKHSWKLRLPKGERYQQARRLNYLAEWLDAGYLTDLFSYRLMLAAGVNAPRPRFIQLTVNQEPQGIYTQLEEVDKHFLRNHGLDPQGNVYRCGSRDCEMKITPPAHYQRPWAKRTNELEPFDDLNQLLWKISRTPEHEFERLLEEKLDLEEFLRCLAVYALISAHGIDDSGSFLVHELDRDLWHYVPWDLNNSRMQYWRQEPLDASPRLDRKIPVYTVYDPETIKTFLWKESKYGGAHRPFSVLNQRVWDRPALRNRVLDELERLLATVFSEEQAHAEIETLHQLIRQELPLDPWVDQAHALRAPVYLKQYVTGRIAFLRAEIPQERRRGEGGVVINAIGADGWIELYNRESTPYDLAGKTITDAVREEFKHRLPSGLVVPPRGKLLLIADGQPGLGGAHLPFVLERTGGELALFDGQSRDGLIDLTFFAPLQPGQVYARTPDGSEEWNWR